MITSLLSFIQNLFLSLCELSDLTIIFLVLSLLILAFKFIYVFVHLWKN